MRSYAAASLLLAGAALAQQQQPVHPHIGFVYPAGGRQGTSFEVTVGGQFLNGASEAYVSGQGVKAVVTKYVRPLTPTQANQLREQMQQLVQKKAAAKGVWTADDDKNLAVIREKLADFARRPSSPAIAETALVDVTISADAAPGLRELRLGAAQGLTNPLAFCVGQLPEFSRKVSKVPPAFAVVNGATPPNRAANRQPDPPMDITLPAVVNGQMMPGTADRFRFQAQKGQRLVISAAARELIPYISDAVPGWFQAALLLWDANGKEVAAADHFRFHPDPVLFYEVPSTGFYVLEIHDSIYRGREDFVYRITAGELPFLTGIFPMGGKAGSQARLEASGWNLPGPTITQTLPRAASGVRTVAVRKGEWTSNAEPFVVDTLPETLAKDPNGHKEKAQRLKLPVIVNGRIARPGDVDYFRFDGRAGEEIVAEVYARRLDSPLDSVLRLLDAQGRELAKNDDFEDRGAGLITHQADSRISFKLPAKGAYFLELADTQHQGGPEYAYRLRVSHPQPDFELRVAPSSVNVRSGATVPVTVYALRRDGFAGEIALALKDAPRGFVLDGSTIPAGHDRVRITLTAPAERIPEPLVLRLEGQAEIGGKDVRRPAVPAEDMMQAFAYRHLVAEKEWMLRVIGAGRGRFAARAVSAKPVKLLPGGTAAVDLALPPQMLSQVVLELNEPPEGVSIQKVSPGANGLTLLLRAENGKAKPGWKGNLIVDVFVQRQPNPANGNAAVRRQLVTALPAIPLEIVGKT
jgi:hypothetical protein